MNLFVSVPLVLVVLAIAGCGTQQNLPLSQVKADDPIVPLNPDRWSATVNDLIAPPVVPRIASTHEVVDYEQ